MWLETTQGIITLITSGLVLISTLIGVSIKLIQAIKQIIKNKEWRKIMAIADKAMESVEKTGAAGADKKTQVIEAVKAGCIEIGVDASKFLDDLSIYIDECIDFFNNMKNATIQGKMKSKNNK